VGSGSKKKWTRQFIESAMIGRGIICISDIESINQPSVTPINWKCKICEHGWTARVDNIINKKSGCPNCAGNLAYNLVTAQQLLDKREDDITILEIVDGDKEHHRRGKFLCGACSNIWFNTLHNVLSPSKQQGCRICNRSAGFIGKNWVEDRKSKSKIYVIQFESGNEIFIKVGITKQPICSRFGKKVYRGYSHTILLVEEGTSAEVWEWEQKTLGNFSQYSHIPSPRNFAGRTECFGVQCKVNMIEYIKNLTQIKNKEQE